MSGFRAIVTVLGGGVRLLSGERFTPESGFGVGTDPRPPHASAWVPAALATDILSRRPSRCRQNLIDHRPFVDLRLTVVDPVASSSALRFHSSQRFERAPACSASYLAVQVTSTFLWPALLQPKSRGSLTSGRSINALRVSISLYREANDLAGGRGLQRVRGASHVLAVY